MNSLELRASKAQTDARGASARVVERLGVHNISLLVALAILIIIFGSLRGDVFFSSRNLLNIGLGVTILGVLAMSQTVVIVAGGLDIAVGATVGLTTVSTAMAIQATGSPAAGIIAGLVLGGLAGLVNGIIITYGRVNAVIATLGTMAIFRGIAFIMSDGQSIAIFSDTFRFIGIGRILGLPLLVWILVLTAIAFHLFLARSIVGRNIYALGGNPVVARFSGININRYRVGIYSNAKDWSQIMGQLKLANVQNWTFRHSADTVDACTPAATFTGGDVVLTQYQVATDSPVYDHDHAC